MTIPNATELPLDLEPVTADSFIDGKPLAPLPAVTRRIVD